MEYFLINGGLIMLVMLAAFAYLECKEDAP